jgi:type IV pilus secretin PilQ/predicted competence protein
MFKSRIFWSLLVAQLLVAVGVFAQTPTQVGPSERTFTPAATVSPLESIVNIRVKEISIPRLLDAISAQAKINFVIGDGVSSKRITLFARMKVREILQILAQTKGITYRRVGNSNTYLITRRVRVAQEKVTKIYPLKFASLLPVSSAKESMDSITSQNVTSSNSSTYIQDLEQSAEKGGGESNSAIPILKIIQTILTQDGKISIDPRTNSIIVTDIPDVFPEIEQILAELDKKVPQILIEAQIVEVSNTKIKDLGIEWGGTDGELARFTGGSMDTDYLLRPNFYKNGNAWKTLYPGDADGNGITNGVFSLAQLKLILSAMVTRNEAKFLGKPRVAVMNNTPAIITTARDAAVASANTSTISGGAVGQTTTTVERKRIGLTLKVTPQINQSGYITMLLQPSYADLAASNITVNDQTIYDPISRGVSTLVRVKDGETFVLGGLLSQDEEETVKKVPLFGYIPIIGWLFTDKSTSKITTDLVMFVTPTILED